MHAIPIMIVPISRITDKPHLPWRNTRIRQVATQFYTQLLRVFWSNQPQNNYGVRFRRNRRGLKNGKY